MSTMSYSDAIKSFLLEGLQWQTHAIKSQLEAILSNPGVQHVLIWLFIRFTLAIIVALIFHPILNASLRKPLQSYLGMSYNNINISLVKLKLSIKDIELLPSKSPIFASIILSLFPSANVQRVANYMDYPESKITVSKLSIKIRVSSLAGPTNDYDPCTAHHHSHLDDDHDHPSKDLTSESAVKQQQQQRWGALKFLYHLILRPIIVVKLTDVSVEIEKAYLAPEPPSEYRQVSLKNDVKLPGALRTMHQRQQQNGGGGEELPTFQQDSVLSGIQNEEVADADKTSLFVERWIDHAVAKLKTNVDASNGLEKAFSYVGGSPMKSKISTARTSFGSDSADAVEGDPSKTKEETSSAKEPKSYDEKMNACIHWVAEKVLHAISFEFEQAAIVISGAGSQLVKETRNTTSSPSDANLAFARLSRRERSLTVIGADMISIEFSPDKQCNALFCFVGLHTRVGNPILMGDHDQDGNDAADVQYVWQTIAHPFHLVAEIKGILPFVIWAVNYDYYWPSKALGLTLTSSDIAVSLLPDPLHTVLLHLDDYTDPMSSHNEWVEWLKNIHIQKHHRELSEQETLAYRSNYELLKGEGSAQGKVDQLTVSQMKDMELRMTRFEIMDLRCHAMKHQWKIPKANRDFEKFLRNSQSSIWDQEKGNCNLETPFQQVFPTPLHALVSMVRQNSSILAPHATVDCSVQTLHIDFFDYRNESRETYTTLSIPSSIIVSEVSLGIEQHNILFPIEGAPLDKPRDLLNLTLEISRCKWGVLEDTSDSDIAQELPLFRDRSYAGIVYMRDDLESKKKALSLGLSIAVAPTSQQEQQFGITFETSGMAIVVNPLPLLSAINVLIELSAIPFQSPEEGPSNQKKCNDDIVVTPLGTARVELCIEKTRLIFLIDRKKVPRGILALDIHGITTEFRSGGLTGELLISTEPIVLSAGQIAQSQMAQDAKIHCPLMPFQPIINVDGASLSALFKENQTQRTSTMEQSGIESAVKLSIELKTEFFFFNASPSTIVGMFGVVSSLDPVMDFLQGEQKAREAEQVTLEHQQKLEAEKNFRVQRDVLKRIFMDIDADQSGELSEDELESVVLKLFEENTQKGVGGENQTLNVAERPTEKELKRERDHLLCVMDQNRTDELSFQEMDDAFFRLAYNIDDNHLVSEIKTTSHNQYQQSDEFLSGPKLRNLIYYDDLKEYSSMSEVYRITGHDGLENSSRFPAPSLWRSGSGIDLFWELYKKETGCTKNSLNGQNLSLVQRKLVRSLCNYEFAKFSWKALVQPALYASGDTEQEVDAAHWILDNDSRPLVSSGVIDRLLAHVQTQVKKEKEMKDDSVDIHYDASVVVVCDNAVLRFGSSHNFAKPLVEARITQVGINSSALISSRTWWFVPTPDCISPDEGNQKQSDEGNHLHFRSSITASYLNTKHNHMECFVEPYPCYGSLALNVLLQDSTVYGAKEASSFSINLNCPRFLNINTSRSFFETASVLQKVISQSEPDVYRNMIFDRDMRYLRIFWYARDRSMSGVLNWDDALVVIHSVTKMHWKDEIKGLNKEERQNFVETFLQLADKEGDGNISLDNLASVFKSYTSRCYFSGSKEIVLKNSSGKELMASTNSALYHRSMPSSFSPLPDFESSLGFLRVDSGDSRAIPLNGKLSILSKGYKVVNDILVSPYQTIMLPLKRKEKKKGRRRHMSASGFRPHLTVVPKSDSLDSIILDVRSNVSIHSDIPIKIRIVRLGKTRGKFRKEGTGAKSKALDLTKKHLMAAIRRVVEGSPIVYESNGTEEGVQTSVPLDVLDSAYYHALLIQMNKSWRDPVLLTKEFLFNPMNIKEVTGCHALSGIVVNRERLNVHLPATHGHKSSTAGDSKKSILRRTAWDTTIRVVPFFLLSNGLPFPIIVRTWQASHEEEEDLLWEQPLLPGTSADDGMDEHSSSDDEMSMNSSTIGKRFLPEDIHLTSGAGNFDRTSQEIVEIGQTLRLSGISLGEPLFMQVSQHVQASDENKFMWTSPMQIDLPKLKTGINQRGLPELPKLILDLGDTCDCVVSVSVESSTRVPVCTVYSPYWIMNKTGSKLEYRVAGQNKSYLDSGAGGLPIMIHGSRSAGTNEKMKKVSRDVVVIPVERPNEIVAQKWWDEKSNGKLVLHKVAIGDVDWSENIDLDAAGTHGEIDCKGFIFNVSIESLAGAFHRSNLITISPRFIVKNMLHIAISLVPIFGGVHYAMSKASQMRQQLTAEDKRRKLDLAPGESTVLFNFHNISRGIEKPYQWVCFCVNASRYGASFKSKWHLIPANVIDSHYFGEHDGCFDSMCGILEAKVHASGTGSMLTSISHSEVPPFVIENRSSSHFLRFCQDDAQAVLFELPPMSSCAYTWDNPLGKKKLRATVVAESKTKAHQLENALKKERDAESLQQESMHSGGGDSDDETLDDDEYAREPLMFSLTKGVKSLDARELNKTARYRSPRRKAVFGVHSRSFAMSKVGQQKHLPCPSAKESLEENSSMMSSDLFTHVRIVAGSKIMSFSDSTWLAKQVQTGILREGGNFKAAFCDISIEGMGLYILDDFPRDILALLVRDIQVQKQTGSIESVLRVRHFQVDAMAPYARYPIIIHPLPLGVDRRELMTEDSDLILPAGVDKKECFWMQNEEKPVPVFEVAAEYVPQLNMMWVPKLEISLCPLKMYIDVNYILGVLGIVINSVFKYQDDTAKNLTATSNANDQLKYLTRGQFNICTTYIEKLYIAPVFFDIELNIKSDDPDDSVDVESSLTLHSIAQTTNSAFVSGILSWVMNVGANFAHVSPCFRYQHVQYTDQYCDVVDLLWDIFLQYFMDSIKQSYKVVFSMELLGDPSELLHQWKTGFSDLLFKTRDEIKAGGQDGFGKGVSSLVTNVVGGTAFALGKVSGGVADTLDSLTTNDLTSNHLKAGSAHNGKPPDNAIEGVVEGTKFLGQTMAHGIAGVVGNPYRGVKTGSASGVAKGVASGITGLVAAPFVGALGFMAKTADGVGNTTKYISHGVIESRCRPARMVTWGSPMVATGLPFLKAIGIRVHTATYQKVRRRRIIQKKDNDEDQSENQISSKEYKRIKAAEERRKNPPRKFVSIMHEKDKFHYITAPIRPKLLADAPGNLVISHYAVTFEETLILRSSDLQLGDKVAINFWNNRVVKGATTKATPLGVCKLSVGDIYSSVLDLYAAQLKRKESNLASDDVAADSVIIPVPLECALFRQSKKQTTSDNRGMFEAIGEEMAAIQKSEEDLFASLYDDDSSDYDSDDSFLNEKSKEKEEDPAVVLRANERLYGSISLSFFPIPW